MNIKEFVSTWKGKKELTDLPALDVSSLQIYTGEYEINGVKKPYNYIEFDGWKFSLKASVLSQIKEILEKKPLTTKIQFKKASNGDVVVFDI